MPGLTHRKATVSHGAGRAPGTRHSDLGGDGPPAGTSAGAAVSTGAAPHPVPRARRPYTPPRLEPMGAWSALTMQQSIPLFP